jgi:hypothetical protein
MMHFFSAIMCNWGFAGKEKANIREPARYQETQNEGARSIQVRLLPLGLCLQCMRSSIDAAVLGGVCKCEVILIAPAFAGVFLIRSHGRMQGGQWSRHHSATSSGSPRIFSQCKQCLVA